MAAEIAIRFTADGKAVVQAAKEAQAALQGVDAQAGRTSGALQGVQNAGAGVSTSFASIGRASVVFGAVNAAASGLLSVMQRLPASGIEFAASLEVSQVGMAGILASMTAMDGKATSYAKGMELASGITQRLQREAMMTAATTQELVSTFQALLAPGLAAGMTVAEIEKLTSTGVTAVKSMGMASNQVVQELRDLVQGGITPASSQLASSLGLKDADIARARASAEGLYAFLMKRLKGFEEAGPAYAKTFTGTMDLLAERAKMTASVMFAPLADALKEQAAGIGEALNNDQNVAGLSKISGAVASVATGLGMATRFAIEHSGAIVAVGQAYAAIKFGAMVAGWVASAQAMTAASAASRLQAAQSAAEALANTQVTLTAQQKLAAYIAELAAKQASAQATAVETAGRVAFLETSLAMIAVSREETVSKLAATRSTIAQAEAQLAAARAAGAQSFALALVREATVTLTMAQATNAALVTELAVLGRQQASVHAATAVAIGAQAAATEGAALASGQLAAAQRAASASTGAMGSVIGALGGPVGIAIAAIGLLIIKLASLRSEGQAAALDAQSFERVKTANASGKQAESRDVQKIAPQVEALKSQADQLELNIKNNDPWAINGKVERERLARYESELAKVRQRTAELTGVAAAADAITKKSESGLQVNAMGATKSLDALLSKQKTVSAAQAEAKLETSALDTQLAALKANKTTTPEQAVEYEKKVAEAKKAVAIKLKADLASINKKENPGAGAAAGQAAALDNSQLAFDLDQNKNAAEALAKNYTDAEKIMEARRSAGLISEAEYYAAKLGFLNLNSAAQEAALQADIQRLQQEELTGKKQVDNAKKIADAQAKLANVKAGTAANSELLAIQEAAANQKIAQSYIDASTAANIYIQTVNRQNAREINGIGKGTEFRAQQSGINAIEDKQTSQTQKLDDDLRNKKIDKGQFDIYLGIVNDTYSKEVQAYTERTQAITQKQGEWTTGANEAFANYKSSASNIAAQTENVFTNAFKGMEDALVTFATTGKLSFSSMAQSIISDIMRIIIKQQLSNALGVAGGGAGGGSGGGGILGSIMGMFSGGSAAASAGMTSAGTMADLTSLGVFAKGGVVQSADLSSYSNQIVSKPTMFAFAKGAGLMGEAGHEAIMPLMRGPDGSLGVRSAGGGGGGGNVQITIINNGSNTKIDKHESTDSRGNRRVELTISDMVAGEVRRAGSGMNSSIRGTFGSSPQLVGR